MEQRTPEYGSKWQRKDSFQPDFFYEVIAVSNTSHISDRHPQQVIYSGSNGNLWSMPLSEWPNKLVRKIESLDTQITIKLTKSEALFIKLASQNGCESTEKVRESIFNLLPDLQQLEVEVYNGTT